ncbi:MAG: c-type cytochrome [Deltaproteobacteria bacterium]|nr:c-type cytochrome [Deltaproteobacteria bacterium]
MKSIESSRNVGPLVIALGAALTLPVACSGGSDDPRADEPALTQDGSVPEPCVAPSEDAGTTPAPDALPSVDTAAAPDADADADADAGPLDPQAQYLAERKAEAAAIPDPPTKLPVSKSGYTELQYMIQLGEKLVRNTNTHPLTAPYIAESGLTCSSCHLDAGKKKALASTFIGSAAAFPTFNLRDKGVITLMDRVNSCFMRSMNGTRLPENGEALTAIVAYITWLSQGVPIKMNAERAVSSYNDAFANPRIKALADKGAANVANGQVLYEAKCATCHGVGGEGVSGMPPVWGPRSYNAGAGNANNVQGATWVQFNMPPGGEFTLGDQQALDITAYMNSKPRPAFVENDHLPRSGVGYGGPEIVYHYGRAFTDADKATRVPAP